MPFDGVQVKETEVQTEHKIKAKSRLAGYPDLIEGKELECLAQALEVEHNREVFAFNLSCWLLWGGVDNLSCGYAGCIAGLTHLLWAKNRFGLVDESAKDLLGLSQGQADSLFTPRRSAGPDDPYKSNGAQAAKVVRHLAETGEIDWGKAFE